MTNMHKYWKRTKYILTNTIDGFTVDVFDSRDGDKYFPIIAEHQYFEVHFVHFVQGDKKKDKWMTNHMYNEDKRGKIRRYFNI